MATAVDRGQIEEARLTALLGYGILDTSPEEAFDDLVELAAALCDAPVASIAFVDGTRSWFKAKHGVELSEVPRDVAFSAEVLRHDDLLVVPDARADDRFRSSEFLARGFRFFAGMPLLSPDGYALGALCILDRPPRDLSPTQRDGLQAIARRVMHELEIRRVAHIQVRTGDGFRPLVEQLLGALYIEDLGASTGWYFSPQ